MAKTAKASYFDAATTRRFGKAPACINCGSSLVAPSDFRDTLSAREFEISHLCQKCQDKDSFFGTKVK